MSDKPVKGTRKITSANTMANAMSFLIQQIIRDNVNTAEVVIVESVDAGGPGAATGYVDVKPLVCQTDAYNDTLQPATLWRLPYSRIQGGIAALVIDPVPGDIGIALFAKRDSSGIKPGASDPVQPASFRTFDQADGFYIGGFLNKQPEVWLELTQDNEAILHAPVRVTVETQECLIDAPNSYFTGNVFVGGGLTWVATAQGANGAPAKFQGGLENTGGTVKSNNITLDRHTHPISTGGNTTEPPNTGT